MSVKSDSLVDAIAPATNPRSETMVVGCAKGPIHSIKVLIDTTQVKGACLNAIIVPIDLPPEKKRVAMAIANSAVLFHDLVLSRAWSTPESQIFVWGEIGWINEMHQFLKLGALPQPSGTQIIIP